ncbi:unnamed protein product, partial [Phaeothamnion confervicola]
SILNAVNCTAAPNCTAIGRDDCSVSTGAGLCGRCLDGYLGANSYSNTACKNASAVPPHCSNLVEDSDETDVDCGGDDC